MPDATDHAQDDIVVRLYQPEDRPQVERVAIEGLLPGHVDYERHRREEIRQAMGSERERLLVAEAKGHVIGTAALLETQPDVGQLHWLRVAPPWQANLTVARRLIRAAAEHAREVGLLKLAMHAPAEAADRVASFYHKLGFELSRKREIDGVHVLEFYLNLYERPELDAAS